MRLQITKAFPRAGQLEVQTEDRQIERLFAWLTRNGIGRKFGSLPIGWYQAHQIAAINIIQDASGDVVRVKHGTIRRLFGTGRTRIETDGDDVHIMVNRKIGYAALDRQGFLEAEFAIWQFELDGGETTITK